MPGTPLFAGRIYPGLRPFDTEDAVLFFGRDEQTDELLRRLEATRFLAVVGLSGSGKSSLVRAGLLPALRRGHLQDAGSRWRVAVMRPGGEPMTALHAALTNTLGAHEGRARTLRSNPLGLLDASRQGRNPDENLLLVVDQFEEIFRFQAGDRDRAAESRRFVELLLAATQEYEAEYRVYVVLTLRSDYLGECARFAGLPEALNDSQYLVPRMTREQLREAIEGPAAMGGVQWSSELLRDLLDKTGDDPDQLPILQHLLMRLWEIRGKDGAIGRAQYEAVGGWENALNSQADAIWNGLGPRREIAKRIWQRLTEGSMVGREVRRPSTLQELSEVTGASLGEVRQIVDPFRGEGCNFLTSSDRELTAQSVIDISHESLIRQWTRLREWTAEEAEWGQWYQRVEDRVAIHGAHLVDPELESALLAREGGQWNAAWAARYATPRASYAAVDGFLEESKKQRGAALARLRRTRVLASTAAVLFAALAGVALFYGVQAGKSERVAQQNAAVAESRRQEAASTSEQLKARSIELQAQTEKAREAVMIAEQRRAEVASALKNAESRQFSTLAAMAIEEDPQQSLIAARDAWDKAGALSDSLRETILRALSRNHMRLLLPTNGSPKSLEFSPDGVRILTASDRSIEIWDARSGNLLRTLQGDGVVGSAAFSPDGKRIVTPAGRGGAQIWDSSTGKILQVLRSQDMAVTTHVSFSPNGKWIATTGSDKKTRVWDSSTARLLHTLDKHTGTAAVFNPAAQELLTLDEEDSTLQVWDPATGSAVRELKPPREYTFQNTRVSFNPEGTLILLAGRYSNAFISPLTGKAVIEVGLDFDDASVEAVGFLSNAAKSQIAVLRSDLSVSLIDPLTKATLQTIRGVPSGSQLVFAPDRQQFAVAGDAVYVFGLRPRQEIAHFTTEEPLAFNFSADGSRIAAQAETMLRVWDTRTGLELATRHTNKIEHLLVGELLNPQGTMAAEIVDDQLRVVEIESGLTFSTMAYSKGVYDWVFSRNGKRLASKLRNVIRVWDTVSGAIVRDIPLVGEWDARLLSLSPNGGTVVLYSFKAGAIRLELFDAATGKLQTSADNCRAAGRFRGFTPDENSLIVAGRGCSWNNSSGPVFVDGTSLADAALWDAGIKTIEAGSRDAGGRVVDSRRDKVLAHLPRFGDSEASRDGAVFATGSSKSGAALWRIPRNDQELRTELDRNIVYVSKRHSRKPEDTRLLMEDWARMQVTLANQNREARSAALERARQVFSRDRHPQSWIDLTVELAYSLFRDPVRQAAVYEELAQVSPRHTALVNYAQLLQNGLLDASKAATIMERFVDRQPGIDNFHFLYAETLLNAGRFEDCNSRLARILIPQSTTSAHIVSAACHQGLGQRDRAAADLDSIAKQKGQGLGWHWPATRRLITTHPQFAANRDLWIAMLDATQKEDVAAFNKAVLRLKDSLR